MAGLTNISFIARPKSISISFIEPSLSRLLIRIPNRSNSKSTVSVSTGGGVITARFSSGRKYYPRTNTGGGNRRPNPSRRFEEEEEDDNRGALDLSSIRSSTVRLIDQKQNMVGIVPKSEAIQMAEDAELDLFVVSPEADPPVVRIVDYSKYMYEIQKKKKDQQKKVAGGRRDQKELKMGYNIDVHDYSVRLKAAQRFLKDGDKVKVIVNLKGRQNEFRKNAIELLARFKNDLGELAIEESRNFKDKNLNTVFVPNKVVTEKEATQTKEKGDSTVISADDSTSEISSDEELTNELSEDDSAISSLSEGNDSTSEVSGDEEPVNELSEDDSAISSLSEGNDSTSEVSGNEEPANELSDQFHMVQQES